jgi:hypothetical protein
LRDANSISIQNNVLINDVLLSSPSAAANLWLDIVDNGFTVLKNSRIKSEIGSTIPNDIGRIQRLRDANSISIQNNVLINDVLLSSPSAAANFVAGYICNGLEYWKRESDGKTLKQIEEQATAISD